jgi:hypothetical protein
MMSIPSIVALTTLGATTMAPLLSVAGGKRTRQAVAVAQASALIFPVSMMAVRSSAPFVASSGALAGIVPADADAVHLGDGGDLRPARLRLRRRIGGEVARVEARPQPRQQVGDDGGQPIEVQLFDAGLGVGPNLVDVGGVERRGRHVVERDQLLGLRGHRRIGQGDRLGPAADQEGGGRRRQRRGGTPHSTTESDRSGTKVRLVLGISRPGMK